MDRGAIVARNRKAAATREAMRQQRLEAKMANAPRGIERGDYTIGEILARVRAIAAKDVA